MQNFYDKDVDIYLDTDEVTDNVRDFISKWDFKKEMTLPSGLQHILGNFNMTIKAIDGFIV
jgi:hypothetical protein